MAEKISTLILKVDLACHKCYNKIRKILCNLQDQERITTISYDTKNNIVVIAGTFDPQRLCCRIRCKGGKVIKDTHIVDAGAGAGFPPPKMADSPPPPMTSSPPPAKNSGKKKKGKKDKHKENIPPPPPPEHFRPPPSPPHQPPPPENMRPPSPPPPQQPAAPQISTMGPAIVEEEKHHERPAELELPSPHKDRPPSPVMEKPCPMPQPPMYHPPPARPCYPTDMTTTTMVEIPSWPAACYQGCYEGCRCGSCGRVYGYSVPSARPPPLIPPPATATCYGGGVPYCGGYSGCRIVNEEDPTACSIM